MRHIHRRLGIMLGLIPVVLLTAACTSPASKVTSHPRPTSTVTAAPKVHEFVSTTYNFRLTLPKDWTGVDADAVDPWDGEKLQGQGSSAFADFTDPRGDRLFTFGAAPVTMGTTLAAWKRALTRGSPCADTRNIKPATLGGAPALTWTSNCAEVQTTKFAAMHGARGYVAIFVPIGARMAASDRAIFYPILRSFRFTS